MWWIVVDVVVDNLSPESAFVNVERNWTTQVFGVFIRRRIGIRLDWIGLWRGVEEVEEEEEFQGRGGGGGEGGGDPATPDGRRLEIDPAAAATCKFNSQGLAAGMVHILSKIPQKSL